MVFKWAFSLINKSKEENHKFWKLVKNLDFTKKAQRLVSLITFVVPRKLVGLY